VALNSTSQPMLCSYQASGFAPSSFVSQRGSHDQKDGKRRKLLSVLFPS
jgi:hypothetical protein